MGQYQTFIIRFWTDDTEDVARGHIQHVATGRGLYFRDIDRMLHFLDEHVSPSGHRGGNHGVSADDEPHQLQKPDPDDVYDR